MDLTKDFLSQFELFGMAIVALVPLIVEGVKWAWPQLFGHDLSARGTVLAVGVACWVLLGLRAAIAFQPEWTEGVKYMLAAILLPLGSVGAYETAKTLLGLPRSEGL